MVSNVLRATLLIDEGAYFKIEKHAKKVQEPSKMRNEQQEIRLQHYVDQALSRCQNKHHP